MKSLVFTGLPDEKSEGENGRVIKSLSVENVTQHLYSDISPIEKQQQIGRQEVGFLPSGWLHAKGSKLTKKT